MAFTGLLGAAESRPGNLVPGYVTATSTAVTGTGAATAPAATMSGASSAGARDITITVGPPTGRALAVSAPTT